MRGNNFSVPNFEMGGSEKKMTECLGEEVLKRVPATNICMG